VTEEITTAWGLGLRLVPMTDERRTTVVTTATEGDVSFQDYFVRLRHSVPVTNVRFEGVAQLSHSARVALTNAETVVIAPSNPLVSIGPIRSLDGTDDILSCPPRLGRRSVAHRWRSSTQGTRRTHDD